MASKGFGESTGTVIAALAGLTGSKPVVPEAAHIDLTKTLSDVNTANISSVPQVAQFASQVNQLSSEELMKQLERLVPGYQDLLKSGMSTISSQLRGEIPLDVQRQIKQYSAETAAQGGVSGNFASNITAENLGRTSLDLSNKALDTASRWIAQADALAKATTVDFNNLFVNAAQGIAVSQFNEQARYSRELLANKIASMPSPMDQALTGALESFGSILDSAGSMMMGGMGGGGGIGGMMGGGGGGSPSVDAMTKYAAMYGEG